MERPSALVNRKRVGSNRVAGSLIGAFGVIRLVFHDGQVSRIQSKQASVLAHPSYLKDNCTRARYAVTLPFSTFRSVFTTSATRKSRSVRAAVSTAFLAASSQDFVLVPIISVTLYTAFVACACFGMCPFFYLLLLPVLPD